MQHLEKAKEMWKKFVPKNGQADTIHGELLRAIEKLRWEAQENGNKNWDSDFEYFVELFRKHLLSNDKFDDEIKQQITKDLNRIAEFKFPILDDDIYDRLLDRVVEWYEANPGENRLEKNPDLSR